MKKLTAGIFASLLTVVGGGAAHAKIASTEYVGAYMNSVMNKSGTLSETETNKVPSEKVVADAIQTKISGALNSGGAIDQAVQDAIDSAVESGAVGDAIAGAVANKLDKNDPIQAGTKTKITYDANGLVTKGEDLTETDIPSITHTKISDWDASVKAVKVDSAVAADSATQATQDASGNTITTHYATKSEVEAINTSLSGYQTALEFENGVTEADGTVSAVAKSGGGITVGSDGLAVDSTVVTDSNIKTKLEGQKVITEENFESKLPDSVLTDDNLDEKLSDYQTTLEFTNGVTESDGTVSAVAKSGGFITVDSDGLAVDKTTLLSDYSTTTAVEGLISAAVEEVTPEEGDGISVDGKEVSVKAKANSGIEVSEDGVAVKTDTTKGVTVGANGVALNFSACGTEECALVIKQDGSYAIETVAKQLTD